MKVSLLDVSNPCDAGGLCGLQARTQGVNLWLNEPGEEDEEKT